MKRIIILVICTISSFSISANTNLAQIIDKDGYTNIRNGPGKEFSVVSILEQDEFFYCEKTDSSWLLARKIKSENGKQISGYIHRSRVLFIATLSDSSKRSLFQSIFLKQIDLVIDFENSFKAKSNIDYQNSRQKLELHTDLKFDPILNIFPEYFCKSLDTLTLQLLMKEIALNRGTADEWPGDMLASCFVCNSQIILREINKTKNKNLLLEAIDYGIDSVFPIDISNNANSIEYKRLKRLINSAKR